MRWTSLVGLSCTFTLMLLAAPALAVEVNDGHATEGTLVSGGVAEFRGDLLAYHEGDALLVLDHAEGGSGAWGGEGEDVDVTPLSPSAFPRVETGFHYDAELALNVSATEAAGLPGLRTSIQRETEVRATADGRAAAALAFAAIEGEGESESGEIGSLADGRLLAVYVVDGVLQVEGRGATGHVLVEAVPLDAPDAARAVGYPVSANPGAYALAVPGAAWTARGDVLALVEGDDGTSLVRLRHGTLFGDGGGGAVAYASSFHGAFDGTLVLGDATGNLDVGPDALALVGQPVRLSGVYTFDAERTGDGEPDGRAEYRLKGRTTSFEVPLDGGVALPAAALIVPAALVALGALVYFAEVVRFAAFAPAMGLFSRIADSELLANEVRDRIHRLVTENPGITLKECMALASVGWGTTVYHLRRLEDSRMVTSIRDGNFRRFYKNGAAPGTAQKAVLGEMRRQPSVRIAQFVMQNPGACQKDLCEALEMSPPLAHKHMRRLLSANLVTTQREWKKVKYYPTESLHKAASVWSEGASAALPPAAPNSPAAGALGMAAGPSPEVA